MRDLHNTLKYTQVYDPDSPGSDDSALVCDIVNHEDHDSAEYVIMWGDIVDSDATFAVLLEESDDSGLSGSNEVVDADMLGTELLAAALFSDDNKRSLLGYIGSKQYTRLTITPSDNGSAWEAAVLCVQGHGSPVPDATGALIS